jgi:hypothetical protein
MHLLHYNSKLCGRKIIILDFDIRAILVTIMVIMIVVTKITENVSFVCKKRHIFHLRYKLSLLRNKQQKTSFSYKIL